MTETKAQSVYTQFRRGAADDGMQLPPWSSLRSEATRPWFAIVNAAEEIAKPPTDTKEPYDYDLTVEIKPIKVKDAFAEQDGSDVDDDEILVEDIPTKLAIRPMVAGDLFLREFDDGEAAFNSAIRAHVHGVSLEMLEFRMDAADADAAHYLLHNATGTDAWRVMQEAYIKAGGTVLDAGVHPWRAAALALLSDEGGDRYKLRCRTPGIGTLEIGPARVGYNRIYEQTAARTTEWEGRMTALARMTGRQIDELAGLRIEDADRAWACYEILKKKADLLAKYAFDARLSSMSTGGAGPTSTTSPSTS